MQGTAISVSESLFVYLFVRLFARISQITHVQMQPNVVVARSFFDGNAVNYVFTVL